MSSLILQVTNAWSLAESEIVVTNMLKNCESVVAKERTENQLKQSKMNSTSINYMYFAN